MRLEATVLRCLGAMPQLLRQTHLQPLQMPLQLPQMHLLLPQTLQQPALQ